MKNTEWEMDYAEAVAVRRAIQVLQRDGYSIANTAAGYKLPGLANEASMQSSPVGAAAPYVNTVAESVGAVVGASSRIGAMAERVINRRRQ
jgi:hypothetical protein